ncbi:MAG TPA: MAPEG family protein [Rhizomicrobium sp.]|nr:MAPEG family protein [Rhizomicrobium sp.]
MTSMLAPALALILLTLVVWIWMYATRIPAMQRAKIDPQSAAHPGSLDVLPSSARRVADNYNHLLEQPTIFYALCFIIVLGGHTDALYVQLAWGYVGLRVVHTLIQCTINVVNLRFLVFALSTIVLMVMAGREAMAMF